MTTTFAAIVAVAAWLVAVVAIVVDAATEQRHEAPAGIAVAALGVAVAFTIPAVVTALLT
jgi:hypothetical protein